MPSTTLPLTSRLLLLAPLLWLSACGGNSRLSRSDYAALHSVSVLKKACMPEGDHFLLTTFSQNMSGALGGMLGFSVAYAANISPRDALRDLMIKQNLDPSLLVQNELEHQLQDARLFPAIRQPADAEFQISSYSAGLAIPSGFATRLDPLIYVDAQLVRRDGKVIWRDTVGVQGDDPDDRYTGHPLDEYFAQPNLLRDTFTGAAHSVAAMLIEDLKDDLKR